MMMWVVAFDIETLGLSPQRDAITCVCMYGSDGAEHRFRLYGLATEAERDANGQAMLAILDRADRLIGYNALAFDLEFIRQAFAIDDARMLRWVIKCIDPLVHARRIARQGCRLQQMLELNGLGSKTGSGTDAIRMAHAGEWEPLLLYCAMDARLTYDLVMANEEVWLSSTVRCRLRDSLTSPPVFFDNVFLTTSSSSGGGGGRIQEDHDDDRQTTKPAAAPYRGTFEWSTISVTPDAFFFDGDAVDASCVP